MEYFGRLKMSGMQLAKNTQGIKAKKIYMSGL